MEGYVKLYRQITKNEFYFSEKFTKQQAWIDLLLLATHKEQIVYPKGVEIKLAAGQLCWSQVSLAERWGWNRKTVKKFLNTLKIREMVDTKETNITTIITIKQWYLFQVGGQQHGQRSDSGMDTNKNVKNVNIELAKLLISDIKKESSLYSIVGKYKNELGDDRLTDILVDCVKRDNKFPTECRLAAYLHTCSNGNGKASREHNFNPIEIKK